MRLRASVLRTCFRKRTASDAGRVPARGDAAPPAKRRGMASAVSRFEGFSDAGLTFLRELERHNERPWFDARKTTYLAEVQAPFLAFLSVLAERLALAKIPLAPKPRSPAFRIYRDVRFAHDKRPYNTVMRAALHPDGDAERPGMLYVRIGGDEAFAAAGCYLPPKPELHAYRTAMTEQPAAFQRLVTTLERSGLPLARRDTLVRVPPAFRASVGTPLEPYAKLTSLLVQRDLPAAMLRGDAIVDAVVDFAREALPLLRWSWRATAGAAD